MLNTVSDITRSPYRIKEAIDLLCIISDHRPSCCYEVIIGCADAFRKKPSHFEVAIPCGISFGEGLPAYNTKTQFDASESWIIRAVFLPGWIHAVISMGPSSGP